MSSADAAPCLHPNGCVGGIGTVPTFTAVRLSGSAPSSSPAALPRRSRGHASRSLPSAFIRRSGQAPRRCGGSHTARPGPYPSGLSRVPRSRGFWHWFTSLRLSDLLAAPARSDSSRASRLCQDCLPPFPTAPGSDCPQLHRAAATARRRGLTPRTNRQRLVAHLDDVIVIDHDRRLGRVLAD
jgi:hypothetical protein